MRHRRLKRKLGIKSQHRRALLRNLVRELVRHKRIRTTHAKAKEASAFADKMVSLAKRGGLHARRLLVSRLSCEQTAKALIKDIAPHFKDRKGGYTRVLRIAPRAGDASEMALLEFSALIESPESAKKALKAKKKTTKSAEAAPEKTTTAEKTPKAKTKKAEESSAKEKEDLSKAETEKKGGFLGTLRKFLKGSE